jgi:hypothetical protein
MRESELLLPLRVSGCWWVCHTGIGWGVWGIGWVGGWV